MTASTPFPVNDTIVVCRPNQVREAAVVLSCLPRGIFTPLVVLEEPPITEQRYCVLYDEYRTARDARDDVTGGGLGRIELLSGMKSTPQDVNRLNSETDRRAELLTPYRSWVKHNRLIGELLKALSLRRAIFLFDAQPEELRVIEPVPIEYISDEHFSIVPESIEWTGLLPAGSKGGNRFHTDVYNNLSDLSRAAWRICRPGNSWPSDPIEVAESDLTSFFKALMGALNSNKPLLPVRGATANDIGSRRAREKPWHQQAGKIRQAVLIEVSNDAAKLLGVVYAYLNNARLILTPQLELSIVQEALDEIQEARSAEAKSIPAPSTGSTQSSPKGQGLSVGISNSVGLVGLEGPMAHLEQVVSAQVSNETISLVAELPLTAVTDGMPYSFVKKSGADWSMKPIAHVTGDISLLFLTELLQPNESSGVGFNLIFDPGFFTTTETTEVLSELRSRVCYSLLLKGETSSTVALQSLGAWLPVELIYFNTHGSDNSIVFKDMSLPAFKIVQRVTLPTRPLIFNNSCLSWTGVGREFIRCGARGYIGTLWSVDAAQAKDYAREVISRLVHQNALASEAVLNTGVGPQDERAYIFVGTVNTRLARFQAGDSSKEKERLYETARELFHAAIENQKAAGIHSSLPFASSLVRLLCNEAESICGKVDQQWPTPDVGRLDLLLTNCDALLVLSHRTNTDIAKFALLLQQAINVVKGLSLDDKACAKWDARIFHLFGRMAASTGRMQEAIGFLNGSIEKAKLAGEPAGWQELELSDIYKALGNNKAAVDTARKGLETFQAQSSSKESQGGELRAIGRLGQLANRLGNYAEALRYAKEGYEKSIVADDPREKASFKGDEARVYVRQGQYDLALTAADDAIKLARHVRDDLMESGAYGILTEVLIGKGDYNSALEKATIGLIQARRRQFRSEVGDFLSDLATIKLHQNELLSAMGYLEEAAQVYAGIRDYAKVQRTFKEVSGIVRNLDTWEAHCRMMELEIAVIDQLDFSGRRMIAMDFIVSLKALISKAGFAAFRKPLQILDDTLQDMLRERDNQASEQLIFISRVVNMFHKRSLGALSAVTEEAVRLDEMSDGGFKFAQFLSSTN